MTQKPPSPWWKGGVIYQIYPRSFADASGDGVGDLAGIRARLGHVASLGVDAIWLSPFFTSPMKDFGYDVSDYRDVDPLFGTLDDFLALLEDAHDLGLKVLIDQVWSHSSNQHGWFKESRASRDNPKSDWYVWADAKPDGTPPNNWLSVFGGPAWTWDTRRGQYYLHNFLREQPDLNFHNREVQAAVLDVAKFWLDLGVDGFRLDVCNFYFHDRELRDNPVRENASHASNPHDWQSHNHCRSQPENLEFLRQLRTVADGYGDICLMGEISDDMGLERLIEYTSHERLHTAYCFDFLTRRCDPGFIRKVLERWLDAGDGWPTWALGNHDFPRVATRWTSGEPTNQKLSLFAAFQMSLMGSVCVYQGEELGLEQADVPFDLLQDPQGITFWPENPGRDGCRTPMPWTRALPLAGFTDADKSWLPIPAGHVEKAVDEQSGEPGSILNMYRSMIKWRQASAILREGDMLWLDADCVAFERRLGTEAWLCVFNFSPDPVRFSNEAWADLDDTVRASGAQVGDDRMIELQPWGWGIYRKGQA